MLLTLTSGDSESNSRFRCNFNESIRIPPNSEIALINASINRLKVIQITDKVYNQSGIKENVAKLKFRESDDYSDVVIPVGDYSLEGLANQLNNQFINIATSKGYVLSNVWSAIKLNDSDGDQSKLLYNWDWSGTQKAPIATRPIILHTLTTNPASIQTENDPTLNPSASIYKSSTAPTAWGTGLYGVNFISEKNSLGVGFLRYKVKSLSGEHMIGLGYVRSAYINGSSGVAGLEWYKLMDWCIYLKPNNTFQIRETLLDDPDSNATNVGVYGSAVDVFTADSVFRINLSFDGTITYYLDLNGNGNSNLVYTSSKKKITPSDYTPRNALVMLMALNTPYNDTGLPSGGGFNQLQIGTPDNSVDDAVGGNSGAFNTLLSLPPTQSYTDFYKEDALVNVDYVDATDIKFNLDNTDIPDINTPEDLVEQNRIYVIGTSTNYNVLSSYRYREITHTLKNLMVEHLYTIKIFIHDLDEHTALSLSSTDNTKHPLEKVKVYCNNVYVGEMEAREMAGEHQLVHKSFNNIYPDAYGEIKVEIAMGFSWIDGLTPNPASQTGIRIERITAYPTLFNVRESHEPIPSHITPFYHNNIPDPLKSGAPSQKITFLPQKLGKYIGFFQNAYYSNSTNSSNGSVGSQSGQWVGDICEFNGVASRIMVDIENLPISTANSQTHSRSHTIANIPRFSQGGSNLGNIYYEASTPLYLQLKNPDEIILNYIDVVLRDVNGIQIDNGILDTNSVVVVNIQ